MKSPVISIITPCFNSEKYIGRYLDSILQQKYKKIQLILINDGSTDKTEQIIISYKDRLQEEGISVIYKYQENKGIGGAVNLGLKYIIGEYFTWCDSDNFYSENYLEDCVEYINNHDNCYILRCDAYTVLEKNLDVPINRFSDGNIEKYNRFLFVNAITEKNFHFGCTLLKTSKFDKVVKNRDIYESRAGQNWQLLLPMFYSYEADYIDKPFFYFVKREDSVSNSPSKQGLEAKLIQIQEHERILIETIRRIGKEEEKYIKMIREKYNRIRLQTGLLYRDIGIIEKHYQMLKDSGGLRIKDNFFFLCGKYPPGYYIYKSLVLILRRIRKLKAGRYDRKK